MAATKEKADRRGGKREGAGRHAEGRKVVEISFSPGFLEKIDLLRKDTPRGQYIESNSRHLETAYRSELRCRALAKQLSGA